VRILSGSRTASALGRECVTVNSFHHQAVRDLAPGLLASGWTEDGLIEAVETAGGAPWLLAVQWHPEEMHAEARAPEHGLFRALVERADGSVNPAVPQQAVG
jgi:putative glutamine amidotransferase